MPLDRPIHRRSLLALLGSSALAPALAQAKTIRLGVLRLASAGAVFIATEKGYFKDEGLQVELKFFDAAQPIAVAVTTGDADFGVTAFTGGFYNLAGKGALKIIAAQAKEAKGYELKSVELKPLQSLGNMVAALKSNQVDAIIIAPHLAKPLVEKGEAKRLG